MSESFPVGSSKVYTEYKYRTSPESAHTGLNPPNELQDEPRLLRPSGK